MADLDEVASSRSSSGGSSFLLCHMIESVYAKVIFHEIHDSYSAESNVECLYQLSESVVPHPDDYIGLFRVGWKDLSECITSVSCSTSCSSSLSGDSYNKVVFKGKDLPKGGLEYYQFWYLTKDHEICGGSTPFKFHTFHEGENLVVLSAEHDFLEVKSSTSLLQHRLAETHKYVTFLEKAKEELENKIAVIEKEKEETTAELERDLAKIKADFDSYKAKELELIMQDTTLADSVKISLQQLSLENSELKEEKCSLQKALSETKDLFHASEECKSLVHKELENAKKSKNEMASTMEDLKLLNSLLKKQLAINADAIKDMEKVWKELEEVKLNFDSEKESWDKHHSELKKQIDDLTTRLKDATYLQKQTDKQCSELEKEIADLEVRLKKATSLQEQKDKQCSELEQQIDNLTVRLKEATELYKKQYRERRTLKKALKSELSRRKDSNFEAITGVDQGSLSVSSTEDSGFLLCHMNESTQAKVAFFDICDSYSADSDVECLYQLSESVVTHSNDYIGMFCIGWQDLSQCVTSVTCSSACISSRAGGTCNKVVFKVKDLPRDDSKYYQFLYVTNDHEIHGSSTPFKFHTANKTENAVVLSAEHDFVEVKSSIFVLQNQFADTQKHVAHLEKEKKELENKITAIEKEKEEAIAQVEEQKNSLQKALNDTKDLFHASEECKNTVSQELENVKKSKDEMATGVEDLKLLNSSLKEQLENSENNKRYMEKVWELEEVKSSFASEKESWNKHRCELEQQINNLTARLDEAAVLQDQKDALCSKLVQQVDDLVARLEGAAKLYRKQFLEIKSLKKALKSKSSKGKILTHLHAHQNSA